MDAITNRYSNNYNFKNSFNYDNINRAYGVPRHENNDVSHIAASVGVLQGLAILLTKASEWCGKKLMQGKEFTNSKNVEYIASTMLKDNNLANKIDVKFIDNTNVADLTNMYMKRGLNLKAELESVAKGQNAFYMDSLKLAVAPKSKPSLLLHELGHAINSNKGKFLRFLQKSRMYAASVPAVLVLLDRVTPKSNEQKTFVEKNAFKIGFLAFLPTIIEEGLASLRGINAAKQVNKKIGNVMNLAPLKKNYAFAWMTYLIAGIGLGVAAKESILSNKNS